MRIENFEEAFKGILAGLDYLTIKKLEYEFRRWETGLGPKLKLSENEILTLNYIKDKAKDC